MSILSQQDGCSAQRVEKACVEDEESLTRLFSDLVGNPG